MVHDLKSWSRENTKSPVNICNISCQKFAQRIIPTHSSRSFNTTSNIEFPLSCNFYHYYDFSFPLENETESMKSYVRDASHLELLSRINLHDRLAGILGILPNHLIRLIRLTNSVEADKIVNDLRFTTFWSKRQSLNRTFWKIVPECCKPEENQKKFKILGNKGKRKRKTKKAILENCQNPFHYLILKKNLEPIHGTCNCASQICRSRKKSQGLETKNLIDFHPVQDQQQNSQNSNRIIREDLSGLDYKHNPPNEHNQTSDNFSR